MHMKESFFNLITERNFLQQVIILLGDTVSHEIVEVFRKGHKFFSIQIFEG